MKHVPNLSESKNEERVKKNIPTFDNQRRKLCNEMCPKIYMNYVFKDKRDGTIFKIDCSQTNVAQYQRNKDYEKLYEEAYVKSSDVEKIHHKICPQDRNKPSSVKLSLDGVQESKSSNVTSDVFSVSFNNCRNVYPIRLIRPINKYKFDDQEQIREVVRDLNENAIKIETCVFDNPKRSRVKNVKSHSALFPCEYCESCAVHFQNSAIETIKKNLK